VKNFSKLLDKFSSARILIVGDVMLDQYLWGSVERISPEAPVPVVRLDRRNVVPGGAANVAANIAGLGARCSLIGVVGNDDAAAWLGNSLRALKISSKNLIVDSGRPTPTKTRVVAHGQHVVRVDEESADEISSRVQKNISRAFERELKSADMVVLSDYAKGIFSDSLTREIIERARSMRIPVIVDPKGRDYSKYQGATTLTPNRREAIEATGLVTIESAGKKLLRDLALDSLLVTRGEEGITIFEKSLPPKNLSALARHVYDVTGAGDTVIATLSVARAAGANLGDACLLANIAAGIVVEEIGTTAVTADQLRTKLRELS